MVNRSTNMFTLIAIGTGVAYSFSLVATVVPEIENDNDGVSLSVARLMGLGTPAWTQLAPLGTAPSGRAAPTAVYDPSSNEMIIFGGDQSRGYNNGDTNDTWVLTNADGLGGAPQWIQLAPTGTLPPQRGGCGAAYDAANNRMLIFGGSSNWGAGHAFNDVWVLENGICRSRL